MEWLPPALPAGAGAHPRSKVLGILYSQEIVQAPDEKRREINARIAKALMGGLWDDE